MKPDIHFDDLNFEKSYNRDQAYAQSKLEKVIYYNSNLKSQQCKFKTSVVDCY